jgi:hypothetical protein
MVGDYPIYGHGTREIIHLVRHQKFTLSGVAEGALPSCNSKMIAKVFSPYEESVRVIFPSGTAHHHGAILPTETRSC